MAAVILVRESAQTGTQVPFLHTSTCPLRLELLLNPPTRRTVFGLHGSATKEEKQMEELEIKREKVCSYACI